MGSEIIESEIPIELSDFPTSVQEALNIFNYLQDNWDVVNGVYLGKVMSGISDVFKILEVDNQKVMLELVVLIDSARSKHYSSSKPKNKTPTT